MLGLLLRVQSWFGKKMFVLRTQKVEIVDNFTINDKILDLGGGGSGIIGRLRGKQVTAIDIRQDELDEAPDGPIKIVADACDLPFKDVSFSAITAFFFFMYLSNADRQKAIEEAYRVLKPGGSFYIWDVTIPYKDSPPKNIFVVPLKIKMKSTIIKTAYGTKWQSKSLNSTELEEYAIKTGFRINDVNSGNNTFFIALRKVK